jgi:hypothetical protein
MFSQKVKIPLPPGEGEMDFYYEDVKVAAVEKTRGL